MTGKIVDKPLIKLLSSAGNKKQITMRFEVTPNFKSEK